ncbi:MAG: hypothetical protein NVS3B21_14000 [Acidimicrobiales bacterium]
MTRRSAMFLRVFAGWTVFVWAVFIRNIAKDHVHSVGFKTVHITLAVISLAFAAGCVLVVSASRRATGPSTDDRRLSGPGAGVIPQLDADPSTSATPSVHRVG